LVLLEREVVAVRGVERVGSLFCDIVLGFCYISCLRHLEIVVWGTTLAVSFFVVYVGLFRPCHFVLYSHTSTLQPQDSLTHTATVIPVLIWDWDQKDFY
jgi:hypothetical protein